MTDEGRSIDRTRPSIARVYDYLLGGTDNYAVDREIGDVFKRDLPGSVAIAFANRAALVRAVAEIVTTTDVRQFIDLGSGLPTADNVHQIAQRHAPESRVVYVDIDPQVLVHGRTLLAENDRTRVVAGDVRRPEEVRAHPATLELIDFERPVAVILSAVLHHVNDEEDPAGIVRYWRDQVPQGSYFFLSHFRSGDNPETAEAEGILHQTFGRGRWRTDEEIASLLDGLEILDPGIVPAPLWRPDDADGPRHGGGGQEITVWERLIAAGWHGSPLRCGRFDCGGLGRPEARLPAVVPTQRRAVRQGTRPVRGAVTPTRFETGGRGREPARPPLGAAPAG